MQVLVSQLPSGGYGYEFPSVSVSPMTFQEMCTYMENAPRDENPLERYMYDINMLVKEDQKILDCYVMDLDFLIFYKKLCSVSGDLTYNISIKCPDCGRELKKQLSFEKDIHFKQIDPKIMNGARVKLGEHLYDTRVPTVKQFLSVFNLYLRYKKITDLKMIKTVALFSDFDYQGNQIEQDILGATHSGITLLLALRDLYYDRLEPVEIFCPECNKGKKPEERRGVVVSVESLITNFFSALISNSPITGAEIIFK